MLQNPFWGPKNGMREEEASEISPIPIDFFTRVIFIKEKKLDLLEKKWVLSSFFPNRNKEFMAY